MATYGQNQKRSKVDEKGILEYLPPTPSEWEPKIFGLKRKKNNNFDHQNPSHSGGPQNLERKIQKD